LAAGLRIPALAQIRGLGNGEFLVGLEDERRPRLVDVKRTLLRERGALHFELERCRHDRAFAFQRMSRRMQSDVQNVARRNRILRIEPALNDLIAREAVKDRTVLGEQWPTVAHPMQFSDLEPIVADSERERLA